MPDTFESTFCSSPWLHARITNDGGFVYCRWSDKTQSAHNIRDTTPVEFFQQHMAPVRSAMLAGEVVTGCHECHKMEQHGKVSGRQKQLLKIGVRTDQFAKTLASSPWIPVFSNNEFSQYPQDWQVDLGNYCNSACIFCAPSDSSRLAAEWKKIGLISQLPKPNWCNDPELVDRFIDTLTQSPHIQYIHFIGGETVITPAFRVILQSLVAAGINKTATIGFTTNLISWDDQVIELLAQFQGVNLGMSVETFTPVNDYVRWPSQLPHVLETLQRWIQLAHKHSWLMQFRITPTVLTVHDLLTVHEYAWEHSIAVESCNFLTNPKFLRASLLPMSYRQPIIDRMQSWIDQHCGNTNTVINIRNPIFAQDQITQDLQSYANYLQNEPDHSDQLPELIAYLKRIEHNRGNSILNYLPEYEELFRTAGY